MTQLKSVLLGALLLLCALAASAADISGRVDTQNPYVRYAYPFVYAPVYLFQWAPTGQWTLVNQTATDTSGMYYFRQLSPGSYVVQVNGQNFPVEVDQAGPFQHILPIFVRRF